VCGSKGYAAAETGRAFANALELSRAVDNDDRRFQALAGVWSFYLLRGDLQTASKQAQDLLAVAEQTQKNLFLLNAHVAMALSLFYQGHFQTAHDHLEHAIPHYEFAYHRSTISVFGWDPGVLVYCYDAQALWFLGFAERAERATEDAIDLAKKLSSPFNEALCYAIHATYHAYRREAAKTLEMAEAALKISNERGFLHWVALASISKGWSLCRLGNAKEGLATFLDGLKQWKSTGAEMAGPTFSVLLGEIYQASGYFEKALDAIEEGLTISAKNNDRHNDAGLYRVKGEVLLKLSKRNGTGDFAEAEECFKRAIDIAHKQEARSLELRAAIPLAGLWNSMRKKRDAHRMLSNIYASFSEGFDTPDLKKARELLDELS
jgi:tetratricopeptide (TPR) repeat protein